MKANRSIYILIATAMFLGLTPILVVYIPTVVAQFLGLAAVGSFSMYLLAIFYLSYPHLSILTSILIRLGVSTEVLRAISMSIIRFPHVPSPPVLLGSLFLFLLWTSISAIACAIAATVVRMIRRTNSKLYGCIIILLLYLGFLLLIYFERMRRILRWFVHSEDIYLTILQRIGSVFEVMMLIMLTTITFSIGVVALFREQRI